MVVPNNNNSSMGGWKHLLDAHRDMVDYRQVAASVVPAPVPTHVPAPVRALPHTNHTQAEPTTPLGKERNIPHEMDQVLVARRDESMTVFFQQANTGRYRPIHRPIPRMPVGLGTELTSTKPRCFS